MLEPINEVDKKKEEQSASLKNLNDEQLIQYLVEEFRAIPKTGTKVIVLVAAPAAGKGVLTKGLAESLAKTVVLGTDDYLKGDRAWRRANIEDKGLDPILKYDPDFLNEQVQAIKSLQEGQELGIPKYDGKTGIAISQDLDHKPDNSVYAEKVKGPQDFIIVEGDFQFLDPQVIDKLIYLDADDNVRLENRIYRDKVDRGEQDEEKIKANFDSRQRTQAVPHTLPQKDKADFVIKVHAKLLENPTPQTKFQYFYDIIPQKPMTQPNS